MTNLALVTANKVSVVESLEQMTLPALEAITAGMPVKIDPTTGKFCIANGSSAGEARIYGIATKTVAAGLPVTAIRHGVLDGVALSAVAYDAPIYASDTDGTLADSAGTVTTAIVGRVIPATGAVIGAAFDKLLLVDITF